MHTHTFHNHLSRTTRVSQYQKKPSANHTHEEEKEGFAQTTSTVTLSQRGLIDPINPAHNQSWLDGRLKLTVSSVNRLWISMSAVLGPNLQNILGLILRLSSVSPKVDLR